VVAAARDLFLAQGVESTSVDTIARRAGVAKGTVYLSFPTKQHLVRAIADEFDAVILARLRTATATAPSDAATAAVAERAVDATLANDLAVVVRSRGVMDAEELAVFLIGA
jgi:AcrR family transcriptional regulator